MIISECVYANRISPKYIYTDEYINFILEKILYEIKVGSNQDIINCVLKYFSTANLVFSTLSITTSFIAVYLTFRRSPYFALVYALNDLVLIILWILATMIDINYVSVLICFIVFLINDIYGFINWLKMEKNQKNNM